MKYIIDLFSGLILALVLSAMPTRVASAQESNIIDGIIGIVGDEIILKSDLENQKIQYLNSGIDIDENSRCFIYEELLYQTLLLHQARTDSIEISDAQIEGELDRRLRHFVSMFGSEEKLEEFYKKSIVEIKSEFYDLVKDQLMVQSMQTKITANTSVTPAEVREYFDKIPEDSIPFIDSELEIAHIVKKPPVNDEEKATTKAKLQGLRDRIMKGEDFGTLAYLYSEDPLSAKKNGELGFLSRGTLVPEFARVAFKLKKGQVSDIVETEYGFHIMQLIARRGEEANIRHILMIPKVSPADLLKSKNFLDSIATIIQTVDSITFEVAARLYSDDRETMQNGGTIINQQTGTTKFESDQLGQYDPTLFFAVDKLEVGEISEPLVYQGRDGVKSYRILKLKSRTEPHKVNPKDDYQRLHNAALIEKQNRALQKWVNKRTATTYIRVNDEFKDCAFEHNWFVTQ